MRLDVTGRHVDITTGLRQLITRRLAKLDRLLNDSAISAQVILTKEKYRHRTEIIIHARGDHMLRGLGEGTGWPVSVRDAAAKIEQQAQKLKGKWRERKRRGAGTRAVIAAPSSDMGRGPRIVRASRYAVKPMSVDEAALEVAEGRDAFLVFRNARTDTINVLFRRSDGHLGLIEPEA